MTTRASSVLTASLGVAIACATVAPRTAEACGGCFAPANAAQTVTDHRMVLSVSSSETTLWDQFSYSGDPSEFSWILPITFGPQVQVHLADDRFMTVLDNLSVPVLYPPTPPGQYCFDDRAPTAGAVDAATASDAGVVVYRQEVVGPYDVSIIGGSDPMAIRNWLRTNGYVVAPNLNGVIDHYTSLHMDFVALRLRPGAGLHRMSPVRITVPTYAPTLPLEMISAGVADKVGLVLIVLAAGRMEAQNFPNGQVSPSDLTYDFNHPTDSVADFIHAEEHLNAGAQGRLWITQSAMSEDPTFLRNIATNARTVLASDAGTCDPTQDGGTGCTPTDPADDMRIALETLGAHVTLTRMHADFAGAALDRDLVLTTSAGGELDRYYQYGHVLNTPASPPPCGGYPDAGNPTQDAGSDPTPVLTGGGGCNASPRNARSGALALAMVALALGLSATRRRARERS